MKVWLIVLVLIGAGVYHLTSEASAKLQKHAQERAELLANI